MEGRVIIGALGDAAVYPDLINLPESRGLTLRRK
jgi:hypothetical protein